MSLPLRGGGMGIRGRLFLVSLLLIAVVGAAGAVVVQRAVRQLVEERIESELVRLAAMARVAVEQADPPAEIGAVDALADALGGGGQARVTIIALDGRVLGDSALSPDQVAGLANHADRPELQQALASGGAAVARRYSDSLGRTMVYVALPYRAGHGAGVVRTAVDLAVLDTVNQAFALVVSIAAAALLAFAVFMSALASHLASRDLRGVLLRIRDTVQRSQQFARPEPVAAPAAASVGDELAGLAGGVQDLASRLELTVAALGAERDRLEALLQSMSEAVLALDPGGRVTLANPAAVELLGLEGPPQGRLLLEIVRAPALAEVARAALAEGLGEGEDASDEIDLPGGQTVVATARPLRGQAGCVLVLHDRTAARRLERVRRDFVANVSHELRTPVAIIRANAESLADGALEEPPVARVFLDAILRNAERLSALIGDLLDLSRIEAGRMELHPAPVSLHEAASRAATEVQPRVQQAHQQLELRIDPALRAWADARALEHILLNLLENASKYTPEAGHIQVVARLEPDGRAVRLAVEDDGPGIPERHRERVFERFYRVDPGRARAQGGTGLGLAIVKHLAESMGGAVGLDPRTPRGSSFWVRLPVRPEAPAAGPA